MEYAIQSAALSLIAAIAAALGGCARTAPHDTPQPKGFVAIVGVGEDDALWPILRGTAERFHTDLGLTIPLRTAAPAKSSVNAQKMLLQRLQSEGMAALCVQVSDPKALAGTLDSLAAGGVQVVTVLRPVASEAAIAHCGLDPQLVGIALADAMIADLDGRGTIALLHADSAGDMYIKRRRAFLARIAAAPGIRIILQYDCRADPKIARTTMHDTMTRFPRLGGWAVLDNWPLCERDTDDPILPPSCRMVAVDPFPDTWTCFENGLVDAMIAADYGRIIERALTSAFAAVMGGTDRLVSYAAPARVVDVDGLPAFKREWRRWESGDGHDR